MHVYIYIYIYIHMYVYMYIYICICIYQVEWLVGVEDKKKDNYNNYNVVPGAAGGRKKWVVSAIGVDTLRGRRK